MLVALPSRDETSGTPRDNPAHRLALRIFNTTRAFRPSNEDWSPWIVVWEARAFEASGSPGLGTKESGTVPPAKKTKPWPLGLVDRETVRRAAIALTHAAQSCFGPLSAEQRADIQPSPTRPPRFEIVCHLADGLNRVASGWPRAELADPTTLLTGSASPSSDWPQIRAEAVRTLLPMVELLLADDGIVANHWRLARGLWDSIDDGSMDWVFQGIGAPAKAELCEALAELVWGDAALLRMLNKKGFMDWWMQLAPSGLSVARSVRLLGLIPSSQFRLSDALAWAAASVGTLGPEDWIAGYGLEMESELPLERGSRIALPDRPSTAHESFTIQRLWPSISFAAPHFFSLAARGTLYGLASPRPLVG